jgi:hypothetical protein
MEKAMKLPTILNGVVLDGNDILRLGPHMDNWLRVHAHMIKQPRSWRGYEELRLMLCYELLNGRRMQVALRIFRRAMVLHKELHEREIVSLPLR